MPLRERLGSLVPDAIKRLRTDDDAAFVEAAREAYRAAAKEAARCLDAGDQAQRHADPPRAQSVEPAADAPLAEGRAPGTEPAAPPWSWATRCPDEPDSGPLTTPPSPTAAARATSRRTSDAPLDHLLHVPESVDVAADDFFAGLTRRVEGDR